MYPELGLPRREFQSEAPPEGSPFQGSYRSEEWLTWFRPAHCRLPNHFDSYPECCLPPSA